MSENPINPQWVTATYEMTFLINNRSPWAEIITDTSVFPAGIGKTLRGVSCTVEFVEEIVDEPKQDSEELMYPI